MAATVQIRRASGAGPTFTDITSINTRHDLQDAHSTANTANPVRIPDAGTNYSHWVHTHLYISAADNSTISSILWYTDGGGNLGTGVDVIAGLPTAYDQSSINVAGETADEMATTHASLSIYSGIANVSGLANAWPVGGTISGVGEFSDYVSTQFTVGSTASAGTSGSTTFYWQYDEA